MRGLIAVIGPTAIGKTKLALHLAQHFNGEIINADSRQVYRFMDVGTAKPDRADQAIIPHHLIDIIDPDEPFSVAVYQRQAYEKIEDIQRRGKLPLLVGGSGLYVWSVIEGWVIPRVTPDSAFRQRLETIAKERGYEALFQELQTVDPVAAAKIMPGNVRRVIRALEIYQATGHPASQLWQKIAPPFPVLTIGLTTDRSTLYRMIDTRIEKMVEQGLVSEVNNLLAKGYSLDLPSMSGIGYRQMCLFIRGELDLADAIRQIKQETHKLARRQYTWFHLNDERIQWFNISDKILISVNNLVEAFLASLSKGESNYEIH